MKAKLFYEMSPTFVLFILYVYTIAFTGTSSLHSNLLIHIPFILHCIFPLLVYYFKAFALLFILTTILGLFLFFRRRQIFPVLHIVL